MTLNYPCFISWSHASQTNPLFNLGSSLYLYLSFYSWTLSDLLIYIVTTSSTACPGLSYFSIIHNPT